MTFDNPDLRPPVVGDDATVKADGAVYSQLLPDGDTKEGHVGKQSTQDEEEITSIDDPDLRELIARLQKKYIEPKDLNKILKAIHVGSEAITNADRYGGQLPLDLLQQQLGLNNIEPGEKPFLFNNFDRFGRREPDYPPEFGYLKEISKNYENIKEFPEFSLQKLLSALKGIFGEQSTWGENITQLMEAARAQLQVDQEKVDQSEQAIMEIFEGLTKAEQIELLDRLMKKTGFPLTDANALSSDFSPKGWNSKLDRSLKRYLSENALKRPVDQAKAGSDMGGDVNTYHTSREHKGEIE